MEVPENLIDYLLAALSGLVAWAWNNLNGRINAITDRFTRHEIHVVNTYPTKQETRDNFSDIKSTLENQSGKLDKIIDQLANKEDRKKS